MNHSWRYLLILSFVVLITACNFAINNPTPPIEDTDLIGEWIVDYGQYDEYPVNVNKNAHEKITFHANGTFEQEYQPQPGAGVRESATGKWRTEKIDKWYTRIYLDGAYYYLFGPTLAKDPTFIVSTWDDILHQQVPIGGVGEEVVLYATRVSKLDSPCDREHDLVLRHLAVGDLDDAAEITYYRQCEQSMIAPENWTTS